MHLSQIWVYPVKSLPGVQLQQAEIDARGFAWDRHWMLVDAEGNFLSQRRLPRMALIKVRLHEQGIILSTESQPPLSIGFEQHSDRRIPVKVWQDNLPAHVVSEEADQWLSDFLGETACLVKIPDDVVRNVDPVFASETDQTGFSDGFPFLLLGQASVDELNQRIDDPDVVMNVKRFRPNLVIEGAPAYAEDNWKRIQIGDIPFRVVKPCSRCVITTIDPQTGLKGNEPLKTLNTYRKRDNKVFFGQNLIHDSLGSLSTGDNIQVIEHDG